MFPNVCVALAELAARETTSQHFRSTAWPCLPSNALKVLVTSPGLHFPLCFDCLRLCCRCLPHCPPAPHLFDLESTSLPHTRSRTFMMATTESAASEMPALPAFKMDEFLHELPCQSRSPSLSRSATPPVSASPVSREILNRIDGCTGPALRAVEQLRNSEGSRPRALSNPPPLKTPLHKILESEDEEDGGSTVLRRVPGDVNGSSSSLTVPTMPFGRAQSMDSSLRRRAGSFLSPLQRGQSMQLPEQP